MKENEQAVSERRQDSQIEHVHATCLRSRPVMDVNLVEEVFQQLSVGELFSSTSQGDSNSARAHRHAIVL